MAGDEVSVKQEVVKTLSEVGASPELSEFFGDAVEFERKVNKEVQRLFQSMQTVWDPLEPKVVMTTIQCMIRSFKQWKTTIVKLGERSTAVPNVALEKLSHSHLKALCSVQIAGQMVVKTGDEITITDASQPNRCKVRNADNGEGFVRIMSCLLPCPDLTAVTAVQRLKIQLLALWTESLKNTLERLNVCVKETLDELTYNIEDNPSPENAESEEKVKKSFAIIIEATQCTERRLDLNKLHDALLKLEVEFRGWTENGTDVSKFVDNISTMDKAVLCYQMLHKQWMQHRRALEAENPPIRVLDKRGWQKHNKVKNNVKYYEYKIVSESMETKEEITYIAPAANPTGARGEKVATEQITQTQSELRRKFVIRAVIDPATKSEIGFGDAVAQGIIDQGTGMYVDKIHGTSMPIPQAMNQQLILVEYQTSQKSAEETSAIGLITIKTLIDNRPYTIQEVVDATTGEKVNLETAYKRGLINKSTGMFNLASSEEEISVFTAIQEGWIIAEYDSGEPEFEMKTYAVNAVVDQQQKKKVQFYEAVKLGLIDKENGNYINNQTGEKIYVGEAIRKGFLKAKLVDNTDGLNIDAENKMVVGRMDLMRKNVLKRVGVISALKKAAGLSMTSNKKQNGVGK